MTQTIAFLFVKANKVLLEYVKNDNAKIDSPRIPRGQILDSDKGNPHGNKMEHALHRLIYKMSSGTLIPLQYEFVTMIDDKMHGEVVSVYFVYSWDGGEPQSETLGRQPIARFRFLTIDDALDSVAGEIDHKILRTAKETIRIRSVLHSPRYQ